MKKILIINGVNLNMLGIRERDLYGDGDYASLKRFIRINAEAMGLKVKIVQSNCEGKIVDFIQSAYRRYDGIIINAGAYTHTSVAILDALKAVDIPTVEVHLTDIHSREEFRHISYVSMCAAKTIVGKGFDGYKEALEFFTKNV